MRTNSIDTTDNSREVASSSVTRSLRGWEDDLRQPVIRSSPNEIIIDVLTEISEEENTSAPRRCIERRICGIDNFVLIFCCIWPFVFIGTFLLILFLFPVK